MTETTKTPAPTIAVRFPDLPRRPAGFAPNPYLGPHWQEPEADVALDEPEGAAEPAAQPPAPIEPPAVQPPAEPDAEPDATRIAAELGRSLQLSRAGALALTRLQLAIKCNDRHAAMAAMDRLHAVDAEMERLVDRLPAPAARDPQRAEWEAIARHLADQKLSLAFEKLALLSEISGPDMVSAQRRPEPSSAPSRELNHANEARSRPAVTPLRRSLFATAAAERQATDNPLSSGQFTDPPIAEWPPVPSLEPTEWRGLPAWLIGLAALFAFVAVIAAVWMFSVW